MSRRSNDGRWQMRFEFATPADAPSALTTVVPSRSASVYTCEPPAPLPGEYREAPARKYRVVHPRGTQFRNVLPVPRPLNEAVKAGHFGHDEQGDPIRPTRQEVREITECHADTLRQLLLDRKDQPFEEGITQYAESFGNEAAERLRTYAHHLARETSLLQRGR